MHVDAVALNFRSRPEVTPDTFLGTVFLGQQVTDVKVANGGDWAECKAEIEGKRKHGFVKMQFLRKPLTPGREALVASVHREWMRFDRGTGQEHHKPFSDFVGEMWKALGIALDGTDRDTPWSAAAISFMVRRAGDGYKGFNFAAAHSKYVHHAIKARMKKDRATPFWGFRLNERKPQVGDIVCRDNPNFAPAVDFDVAKGLNSYRSHCDIIMQIDSKAQKVVSIGGNVSSSVSITEYDLAPGDLLAGTKNVFALLGNMTDAD